MKVSFKTIKQTYDLDQIEILIISLIIFICYNMGGGKSTTNNLKINPSEWSYIPGYARNSKIVRSNRGAGDGEEQVIVMNPKSNLQTELSIYNQRRNNQDALVQALGVESLESTSKGMCGSQESIKVITERIPYRLSQLPQMTLPQILYILNQSLKGYKKCYRKAGAFDVTDQMIGINNNGEVRVWVNPNFADNHPVSEKPLLQTTGKQVPGYLVQGNRDQTDMVQNIIDVIEEKCEKGRCSDTSFRDQLRQCRSFASAQNEIQRYAQEKKIWVPNHIIYDKILVREHEKKEKNHPQKINRPISQHVQVQPTRLVSHIQSQPMRTTVNYIQPTRTIVNYQQPIRTTYIPHVYEAPMRKSQQILRTSKVLTNNIPSNIQTYAPVRAPSILNSSYIPQPQRIPGNNSVGKGQIKFNYQSHI